MMPHLLHIVPVVDNAVLDGVLERQDTALGLRLVADVAVLLTHSHHHALVARAADNRRKHSTRRVISGKSGFHHTRAIVNHARGGILIHSWAEWFRRAYRN